MALSSFNPCDNGTCTLTAMRNLKNKWWRGFNPCDNGTCTLTDIMNPVTMQDNGKANAMFVDFAKRGAFILIETEVAPSEPVTP